MERRTKGESPGPRELQNGERKDETRRSSEGTEAKCKENRVAVVSSSEGASAGSAQGRGKPRPILEGARGGAEGTEREDPTRCRWHASMGCPENPLTREWLSVWPLPEAVAMAHEASCMKSTNRSSTQNIISRKVRLSRNTSDKESPTLGRPTHSGRYLQC